MNDRGKRYFRSFILTRAGAARSKANVTLAASRIEFRIRMHLGNVVEESDGDLMGDGVNS